MCDEVMIDVPAELAWAVVGESFGDIAAWASPITASSLDPPEAAPGSVRTCHIRGFGPVAPGIITERLIRFDPAGRSLAYEWVEGRPAFIVHAISQWSVQVIEPGQCAVRVQATLTLHPVLRPFGPLLRWWMRRDAGAVLEELAHRLETGSPHPRKLAASDADPPTVR